MNTEKRKIGRPKGSLNLTHVQKDRVVEMSKQGLSASLIAREMSIAVPTIYRVLDRQRQHENLLAELRADDRATIAQLREEVDRLNNYISVLTGRLAELERDNQLASAG